MCARGSSWRREQPLPPADINGMKTTPGCTESVITAEALADPDLVRIFTSPGCCNDILWASRGLISRVSGAVEGWAAAWGSGACAFTGPQVSRRGNFLEGFSSFLS